MISFVPFLSWIAMLLSIVGQYAISNRRRTGFIYWGISNLLWILINILSHWNSAQVCMYLIFTVLNIYGWDQWQKNTTS